MIYMAVMRNNFLNDWWGSYGSQISDGFRLSDRYRFRFGFRRRRPLLAPDNDLILMSSFVIVMPEDDIVVTPFSGFFTRFFPLSLTSSDDQIFFSKPTSRACPGSAFIAADNDLLIFSEVSSRYCS